jgi:hypothetical protein
MTGQAVSFVVLGMLVGSGGVWVILRNARRRFFGATIVGALLVVVGVGLLHIAYGTPVRTGGETTGPISVDPTPPPALIRPTATNQG